MLRFQLRVLRSFVPTFSVDLTHRICRASKDRKTCFSTGKFFYNYCLTRIIPWLIKLFLPTVINCTSLTVNPSGPLRMNSCANHYGAQCNFSCTIGYRLNGSSAVTCVAHGNQHPGVWNNTIPTCEGKGNNLITFKIVFLLIHPVLFYAKF